jgi:hypothetical protein
VLRGQTYRAFNSSSLSSLSLTHSFFIYIQTDYKRARFRADSTIHDDKLISCLRRHCHGERDAKHGRSAKSKVDDDDDEGSDDSGMEEMARAASISTSSVKGKAKANCRRSMKPPPRSRARKVKLEEEVPDDAQMNVDEGGQDGSLKEAKPVSRQRSPRAKPKDKEKSSSVRSSAKPLSHKTSVTAMFAGVELEEKPNKKRKR